MASFLNQAPSTTAKVPVEDFWTTQILSQTKRNGLTFGRWITAHNWDEVIDEPTVDGKTTAFYRTVYEAIDKFFPQKKARLHHKDKPWFTAALNNLIHKRQRAHSHGQNAGQWTLYRTARQGRYSGRSEQTFVSHLPDTQPTTYLLPYLRERIKVSKAPEPDNISPKLIKEFAFELSTPMTDILNLSLQEGKVPAEWKEAIVVPVPKELPADLDRVRPV
ncbi:hypothetical protein Bbelb_240090 [Branchiostoma belcheri]|nr:hypothetical protein Bbelb_240090 [Branchiostoma belcheri]